jgi:hypothetical protein
MTVENGKKACVSYESNATAERTWRTGAVGVPGGAWSTDLPSELSDVSVFLVTATEDGAKLTMTVEKVVDDDKDCEEDNLDESIDPPEDCDLDLLCDPTSFLLNRAPGN